MRVSVTRLRNATHAENRRALGVQCTTILADLRGLGQ
jgi:hypothetical protein